MIQHTLLFKKNRKNWKRTARSSRYQDQPSRYVSSGRIARVRLAISRACRRLGLPVSIYLGVGLSHPQQLVVEQYKKTLQPSGSSLLAEGYRIATALRLRPRGFLVAHLANVVYLCLK